MPASQIYEPKALTAWPQFCQKYNLSDITLMTDIFQCYSFPPVMAALRTSANAIGASNTYINLNYI